MIVAAPSSKRQAIVVPPGRRWISAGESIASSSPRSRRYRPSSARPSRSAARSASSASAAGGSLKRRIDSAGSTGVFDGIPGWRRYHRGSDAKGRQTRTAAGFPSVRSPSHHLAAGCFSQLNLDTRHWSGCRRVPTGGSVPPRRSQTASAHSPGVRLTRGTRHEDRFFGSRVPNGFHLR